MDISKVIAETNNVLDDWQARTGCDNVTRFKITDLVLLSHYHNALAEELKSAGIDLPTATYSLPENDL